MPCQRAALSTSRILLGRAVISTIGAAATLLAGLVLSPVAPRAFSVGEQVRAFYDLSNRWGMAISPDGTRVALSVVTGDDQLNIVAWFRRQRVAVYDLRDGRLLHTVGPDYTTSGPFAFTPDGQGLLTVRYCLDEAECRAPDGRESAGLFVETDLRTGAERILHRTQLGSVTSLIYDASNPHRVIFSAFGRDGGGYPAVIASFTAQPASSPPSQETILHRWTREQGHVWRLLGGSADGRVLFTGDAYDAAILGLRDEVRAMPAIAGLGVLRLFAWEAGADGRPARVTVVPLRLTGRETWRVALPLAATPDGQRVLLAATVPGRSMIAYGAGGGSYGLSTELYLLEAGRATRLTQVCGIVQQAALSPDGARATAIAGSAVTRERSITPIEVYGLDVDRAAAADGISPEPSGILAMRRSSNVAQVGVEQRTAACTETWPDPPPGRIAPSELLQRVASLAAQGSIRDKDLIAATLRVRFEDEQATSSVERRFRMIGDDIAYGAEGREYPSSEYRVRTFNLRSPATVLHDLEIGLARTGPCVTLQDVMRAFGSSYVDEQPAGGRISFLHHGHRQPIGNGRSDVDTAVYRYGQGANELKLSVVFGMERCAERIALRQSE